MPAPLSFTTTGASISAGWKYVSTTNNGGNCYTYKFTYTTPTTLAWNTGSIDIKLVSALWSYNGISLCSYNTAGVTAVGDWSATIDGKAWSTAKTPLNI